MIILMRAYAHRGWAHRRVSTTCLTWKNSKIFLCSWHDRVRTSDLWILSLIGSWVWRSSNWATPSMASSSLLLLYYIYKRNHDFGGGGGGGGGIRCTHQSLQWQVFYPYWRKNYFSERCYLNKAALFHCRWWPKGKMPQNYFQPLWKMSSLKTLR